MKLAMNEPSTYYSNLIARYLSGEADEGEMHELISWLKSTPENEMYFRQLSAVWNMSNAVSVEKSVNLNDEWAAIQKRMTGKSQLNISRGKQGFTISHLRWLTAAIVLLAAITSVVLFQITTGPKLITVIADGTRQSILLPDSTVVVLNKGAIVYPETFASDYRHVALSGEAWFEVAHDSAAPFVVNSGDLRLLVLGTKFYMESTTEGQTATVVLAEGKVAIFRETAPDERLILHPGERAGINPGKMLKMSNQDANFLAWKTGHISFTNQPLSEVASVLSKVFEKNIVLDNTAVANCRLTADFDQQNLDAILQVISSTLDLTVSRHEMTIILSGKGCR
ncbi:MAG: hypothetical protein CVU06_05180 [Bacteroidetes bacterium HGW-Bacteroidetes-22]|nr:MAG: hypothetical protein CVU06_05180 [Bacteroidetes bacterium HGW-Bacteroidetes-22]